MIFMELICDGCAGDVDAAAACDAAVCSHVDLCADCAHTCDACGFCFCAEHFDGHVCPKSFPLSALIAEAA
jgi:hypothetical protein